MRWLRCPCSGTWPLGPSRLAPCSRCPAALSARASRAMRRRHPQPRAHQSAPCMVTYSYREEPCPSTAPLIPSLITRSRRSAPATSQPSQRDPTPLPTTQRPAGRRCASHRACAAGVSAAWGGKTMARGAAEPGWWRPAHLRPGSIRRGEPACVDTRRRRPALPRCLLSAWVELAGTLDPPAAPAVPLIP